MSCFICGKDQPSDIEFEVVCSDCGISMCDDCKDNDENMCDCYGTCDHCGCDVNRGDDGFRTMEHEWLCYDCKIKYESECDDDDDDRITRKKMKKTFKHIRDNWKEEEYQKCLMEWKQIQPFISKEATAHKCRNCDTFWISNQYIIDNKTICPKCDTYFKPVLCNPVNWLSVVKYIDPKFHHYLIPNRYNIDISSFLLSIKYEITGRIGLIGDDFTAFLDGLTQKKIHFEYIGFYEENTKTAYIYLKSDDRNHLNIIYNAWEILNDDDADAGVIIYELSNGYYSKRNDYHMSREYLHNYLIKMMVDGI